MRHFLVTLLLGITIWGSTSAISKAENAENYLTYALSEAADFYGLTMDEATAEYDAGIILIDLFSDTLKVTRGGGQVLVLEIEGL